MTRHYHSAFRFTPYADELTLAAAAALMDAESIGEGRSTDLLAIRLSATDYVGHAFGPDSLEAEDNLFQLDNIVANLLTLVEDKVGLEHPLVVLTSDHGTPYVPEYLASRGENAIGGDRGFLGSLGTQSVRLFDLVVARTGLNGNDARGAGFTPFSVDSEHWDHKVYYPGAKRILIRITGERRTGGLHGAQMIGFYGTEVSRRVDVFAFALHYGMSVEALNELDLSYTPPLSSPWDPVQMAAQAWVTAWEKEMATV